MENGNLSGRCSNSSFCCFAKFRLLCGNAITYSKAYLCKVLMFFLCENCAEAYLFENEYPLSVKRWLAGEQFSLWNCLKFITRFYASTTHTHCWKSQTRIKKLKCIKKRQPHNGFTFISELWANKIILE